MRKILMICAALAFLTNGTAAFAQDAVVKKIIEIGKTDNQVMHQIDILTAHPTNPVEGCADANPKTMLPNDT